MKKIIFSLMIIAMAAAVVVGGTTAYFSDEEASEGNTFTAGSIDLKVSDECHYYQDDVDVGCQTDDWNGNWDATDLGVEKFFNFADLKPGDYGENTIDFIITSNEAWMCGEFSTVSTEESLIDPELTMEPADTDEFGELSEYLEIMWWADDGNNLLDDNETPLFGGPRTLEDWLVLWPGNTVPNEGNGILPLTFADSIHNWNGTDGDPLQPDQPFYLGVAWCLGDITPTPGTGVGFDCDGSLVTNYAQTDQVVAKLGFTVEQSRNNGNYLCPEHDID